MSVYESKVILANGQEATLEEYKGKVLLIVNTATGCGFTPQYKGLQKLNFCNPFVFFIFVNF